ncbi:MAG TPA: ferredoxin [Acetobacteraceae bacterium]
MFVILTSKMGQFRTEIIDGLRPCEAYDYLFYGQKRAHFVIAELLWDVKVRVIDESPPPLINEVPSKFLPKFDNLEQARAELRHLTRFGGLETALELVS